MTTNTSGDTAPRPLLTVSKLLPQGRGLSAVLQKRAATVELDWDVRQKSRFDATDSQGRTLGVFLARGQVVRGGDILVAEDGSLIRVVAQAQLVMIVRACAEHGSPFDLLRAAYHLGNRHVQLQLEADHLKLEPDHVLAAMLERMHLIASTGEEAFEPEGGAYAAGAAGHDHEHEHAHDHGHDHDHDAHDHTHDHDHAHGHGHEHPQAHAHSHEQAHGRSEVDAHGHDHLPAHRPAPTAPPSHEHPQSHGETPDPENP